MSSKMQLTGHSRASQQLWIVQKKYLDVVLPCLVSHKLLHTICSGQLARNSQKLSAPNRWLLQMSSKMQLTGCSRHPDGSKLFQQQTLSLSCLSLTSLSQLTIANLHECSLALMNQGNLKCLQRCSWRTVPGLWTKKNCVGSFSRQSFHMRGSNW